MQCLSMNELKAPSGREEGGFNGRAVGGGIMETMKAEGNRRAVSGKN